MATPDFVTHYYRACRPPFLNLSEVPVSELPEVLSALQHERASGTHHRLFGQKYVAMRRLAEERLRALFVLAGGQPDRTAPHYFVLGESAWFRGLATDMREVRVPLPDLPLLATSFTYGDSFEATGVGAEFGYGARTHRQPYHDRAFLLSELRDVIDEFGLPTMGTVDTYVGYEHRPLAYIEVQLWSDAPIEHLR